MQNNYGLETGLKNGMTFTGLQSGLGNGMHNDSMIKSKMILPTNLTGYRLPTLFWSADNTTNTGPNTNISGVRNLAGTVALSINSDPFYSYNNSFFSRGDISFDANDSILTNTGILGGGEEATVMMVIYVGNNTGYSIYEKVSSQISATVGDFSLEVLNNRLRSTLVGFGGNTFSILDSIDLKVQTEPILVTIKYRIGRGNATGTAILDGRPYHEMYINGVKNVKIITDDIQSRTEAFTSTQMYFGANSSAINGGGVTGSALVLPYCINESEQTMLENYFRWYYGFRF